MGTTRNFKFRYPDDNEAVKNLAEDIDASLGMGAQAWRLSIDNKRTDSKLIVPSKTFTRIKELTSPYTSSTKQFGMEILADGVFQFNEVGQYRVNADFYWTDSVQSNRRIELLYGANADVSEGTIATQYATSGRSSAHFSTLIIVDALDETPYKLRFRAYQDGPSSSEVAIDTYRSSIELTQLTNWTPFTAASA